MKLAPVARRSQKGQFTKPLIHVEKFGLLSTSFMTLGPFALHERVVVSD